MIYRGGREIYTSNELTIRAPLETIFALAADVTRWPLILPHYRYVRVLRGGETQLLEMGASRSGIPVRWTSTQMCDVQTHHIRYEHVHGVTRGMVVQWTFAESRGGCRVSIEHWLVPSRKWLKIRASQIIVGRLFVMHIADKTLHGLAHQAESLPDHGTLR